MVVKVAKKDGYGDHLNEKVVLYQWSVQYIRVILSMSHTFLTQETTELTQRVLRVGPAKVRIKLPREGNNSGASQVYTK